MLLGVHGKAGAGKDTVARLLIAELAKYNSTYVRRALADAVREMYADLTGIPIEELEGPNKEQHRPGMQELGDGMRQSDPYYWIRELCTRRGIGEHTVVPDVRYKNEKEWAENEGIAIKVFASLSTRKARRDIKNSVHVSEVELDDVPDSDWFHVFNNDGTMEDLERQVRDFVQANLPLLKTSGERNS